MELVPELPLVPDEPELLEPVVSVEPGAVDDPVLPALPEVVPGPAFAPDCAPPTPVSPFGPEPGGFVLLEPVVPDVLPALELPLVPEPVDVPPMPEAPPVEPAPAPPLPAPEPPPPPCAHAPVASIAIAIPITIFFMCIPSPNKLATARYGARGDHPPALHGAVRRAESSLCSLGLRGDRDGPRISLPQKSTAPVGDRERGVPRDGEAGSRQILPERLLEAP